MAKSLYDICVFWWLCIKEAAHGTIERANAWFWLIGVPVVWIAGRYWEVGELTIPDNPQGFLTFMAVTFAVSWVVFFIFRLIGAPSRLYWRERRSHKTRSMEVIFGADYPSVEVRSGLHGPMSEMYSIGVVNNGDDTIHDVTVRALDSWFTETIIAPGMLGHAVHTTAAKVISLIRLESLHPHAPEYNQMFGLGYSKAAHDPDYILNKPQRFTIEAIAKDTPAVRAEFEYDPEGRPMVRKVS